MGEWLEGIPWAWVGEVVTAREVTITGCFGAEESVAIDRLAHAWRSRSTST